MALYWISFCAPDKAPGTQFLGVAIVDGNYTGDKREDLKSALQNAWRHNCNPGGEAAMTVISGEAASLLPEEFKNVLLSKERLAQLEKIMEAKQAPKSHRAATPGPPSGGR